VRTYFPEARSRALPLAKWHKALCTIPRGLESWTLDSLLDLARGLDVWHGQAHLLTALAPRVTKRNQARTIQDARAAIAQAERSRTRIELLLELGRVDEAKREFENAVGTRGSDDDVISQLARGHTQDTEELSKAAARRAADTKQYLRDNVLAIGAMTADRLVGGFEL